jgi:hypothetical protein
MYRFHITIHARGKHVTAGKVRSVDGRPVRTLSVPREALGEPMAVSFEEARAALAELPRIYVEPDGSLVWVSSSNEADRWQVDGVLYDRAERLLFVDLSGSCPSASFDAFLRCLGWPETPLMFQLTRQAVFLDETEFRRFAADDTAAGLKFPV